MIYIANALLIIIAGIFVSVASLSEEGKLPCGWNKEDTWMNKYKPHWLPLRTSVFAFTTDLFHFAQWTWKSSVEMLISVNIFNGWWILVSFVAIKLIFSGVAQATRWLFTGEIDG